ncbi:MAG: hypothetical protein ACP5O2_03945 [Bacteroidales bacterium]
MDAKDFKIVAISTGIGFLLGLATVIITRADIISSAQAQDKRVLKPPKTEAGIPAQAPGVQDFNIIRAETIETKSLQVKGDLELINGNGKRVASLGLEKGLPVMTFWDPRDGLPRIKLSLTDVSSPQLTSYPNIQLLDSKGRERMSLSVSNTEEGLVILYGPETGDQRFRVSCDPKTGTQLYLGFRDDMWSLLQSTASNSELIVNHGKFRSQYGVVIK